VMGGSVIGPVTAVKWDEYFLYGGGHELAALHLNGLLLPMGSDPAFSTIVDA
jgi:hypothetical protein